jgi:hypothetical protein
VFIADVSETGAKLGSVHRKRVPRGDDTSFPKKGTRAKKISYDARSRSAGQDINNLL